jgi:hypothetical protein
VCIFLVDLGGFVVVVWCGCGKDELKMWTTLMATSAKTDLTTSLVAPERTHPGTTCQLSPFEQQNIYFGI